MMQEPVLCAADLRQIARLGAVAWLITFIFASLSSMGTVWYSADRIRDTDQVTFDLPPTPSKYRVEHYSKLMLYLTDRNPLVLNATLDDGYDAVISLRVQLEGKGDPRLLSLEEEIVNAHKNVLQGMKKDLEEQRERIRHLQTLINKFEGDIAQETLEFLRLMVRNSEQDRSVLVKNLSLSAPPKLKEIRSVSRSLRKKTINNLALAILSSFCVGFLVGYGRLYSLKKKVH
jgi:hypothetical protein